jgi:DNA repair protein RadC
LQHQAVSIILSHNHPSGTLRPSQLDIDLTKKIAAAGRMLEINVLDHIIFTNEGFYSFADEGIM